MPSGVDLASVPAMPLHARRPVALFIAVLLVVTALFAAPAVALRSKAASVSALQGQIDAGKVRSATFNKKAHTVHITLTDGTRELVSYPSHNEPQLAAQQQAKGARVKVDRAKTTKKPAAHRLRYIAAGVLVVLVVIVALVLGLNRRRPRPGSADGRGGAETRGAAPPDTAARTDSAAEPDAAPRRPPAP